MNGVDLQLLTGQTRAIIQAVGYGPALALLRARGGTRIRVPRRGVDCSMLETTLGSRDAVLQLIAAFPDQDYLYLPKAKKIVAQLRDARIRDDRADGASINQLAIRYDLTASYIKVLLANNRDDDDANREPDLFGT